MKRIVEATAAKLAEKKTIRREYNTELEQVITLLLSFSFSCLLYFLSHPLFSPCQESLRLSLAALRSTKARRRRRRTDLNTNLVEMPGLQQKMILSAAPLSDGQVGTITNSGTTGLYISELNAQSILKTGPKNIK